MKAKISILDPTGVREKSREFSIPLVKDRRKKVKRKGLVIYEEPMKQERYLLEVGGYRYYVNPYGRIEEINWDKF